MPEKRSCITVVDLEQQQLGGSKCCVNGEFRFDGGYTNVDVVMLQELRDLDAEAE